MKYTEFEDLISSARMRKYITACGNDTRKAMKLYRLNLTICFGNPVCISDVYTKVNYNRIKTLFSWMGVDSKRLLYCMDNVESKCLEIMNFLT